MLKERALIRQPEKVDKCSIPSSGLNQIRLFGIKAACSSCLGCSNERSQLSPPTWLLHHRYGRKAVKITMHAAEMRSY